MLKGLTRARLPAIYVILKISYLHSLSQQSKSQDFRETPGKGRVLKPVLQHQNEIYQGFHAPIFFTLAQESQLDPRPVQPTLPAPRFYLDASAMPPASAQLCVETNACTFLKASNKSLKTAFFFQRSKYQNLSREITSWFSCSQKNHGEPHPFFRFLLSQVPVSLFHLHAVGSVLDPQCGVVIWNRWTSRPPLCPGPFLLDCRRLQSQRFN